jgi:methionyl-tRNA formyltransferase
MMPSPVQREAERLGLAVYTPLSLKDDNARAEFRDLRADVAVVVAYGLLLPEAVLNGTRLGCYNGHASLLPRWRGAAPIQRAIMAGDRETGMMVMKMERGLDTGPVALTANVAIGPNTTAGELHDQLMQVGARLIVEALTGLEKGSLPLTPQSEHGVLYASKIEKAETRIRWSSDAADVHNHIRGLSPFPGAWFELGEKAERVKVLRCVLADGSGESGAVLDDRLTIACQSGAVRLIEVQKAGGKPMAAQDFLRGVKLEEGMKLQ